jgi:hypothetical protein
VTRYDTVLRARRLVTAGREQAGSVGVTDGRIAAVELPESDLEGRRVVELGDDVVLLPGLVDAHVHVNEPGRTEWEGFASATRAAAAGGVTTLLDMPLNSIPSTVDVAALEVKRKSAHGQCFVDVGFWGGAVPGNLGELTAMHAAGEVDTSGSTSSPTAGWPGSVCTACSATRDGPSWGCAGSTACRPPRPVRCWIRSAAWTAPRQTASSPAGRSRAWMHSPTRSAPSWRGVCGERVGGRA